MREMLYPLVTNDFEVELLVLICMKPEVAGLNPHSCSRVVVVTVHELYPVLSHIYSYLKETIKICMKKWTKNTYGYMMQDACSWKNWWSNNVLFKEKQKKRNQPTIQAGCSVPVSRWTVHSDPIAGWFSLFFCFFQMNSSFCWISNFVWTCNSLPHASIHIFNLKLFRVL